MSRASDRRIQQRYDPLLTEPVVLSIGPQHPSLSAPLQLHVQADGELVQRVTPECGFMHRGVEKLCESRTYSQCAGLISRCEWLAGANGDYLVAAAVEELSGISVPERAQWLRTLVLELSRVSSHPVLVRQAGARGRRTDADVLGARGTRACARRAGAAVGLALPPRLDCPGRRSERSANALYTLVEELLPRLLSAIESYESFFSDNAIWVNRSELIGVLDADYAIRHGASGPVLRGSGIDHDLRRDSAYCAYAQCSFVVPLGEQGDVLDRYRVRFMEMRASISILRQCLEAIGKLQGTPVRASGSAELTNVPKGEMYVAVEGPRGELGLSVVSNGTDRPERMHLRGPSLYHLMLMDELCRGYLLADVFVIYGSLDIMIGEVDR